MGDPASSDSEVVFLRSQVAGLQARLCDALAQQVAQQQTVLIASMQTNLALTQTVDRMNRIADSLEMQEERASADARRQLDGEFGTVLATLASYLAGGVGAPGQGNPPLEVPKEIADLIRRRGGPQSAPGAGGAPTESRAKKPNSKEAAKS